MACPGWIRLYIHSEWDHKRRTGANGMNRHFTISAAVALGLVFGAGRTIGQSVVVDNTSPGFSVLSESWTTTSVAGQYGADYRYRLTIAPFGQVQWNATIPAAGIYTVSVWYRSAIDRPSNAKYTVTHAGGTTDVFVDQRVNGSLWVPLGDFSFAAGPATVTLSSEADPNVTIVADAVKFNRTALAPTAAELRGCWLTQYYYLNKSESQLRALARNIKAGNMNIVYIAMYSGATVYWPSQAYRAAGGNWASSSVDYADYLIDLFHSEGLKVGAWLEYGCAVGLSSHPIAVAHPDWLARDQSNNPVSNENGGFVFLSPTHPSVRNMLNGMVKELAENYDFDDIELDRMRWSRVNTGREFGYETVTASLYQSTFGSAPPTNVNNSQWVTFRENQVNALVQQLYATVKTANPNIVVSSAPTGSYGITQFMQRWSTWMTGGYIDVVFPQMYQTTLSGFQTELNTQRAQIAASYYPRVGVGYKADGDADWTLVRDQLNFARNLGHNHGTLWVYHQYTNQVAIQDEIDNLPGAGQPWQAKAYDPFGSPCMLQIVVDNRDTPGGYAEGGIWSNSAQPDYFRFDSRVVAGGSGATATFSAAIPVAGQYDVYAWFTASSNRAPAAAYMVQHRDGAATVNVDQRANGGRWVLLGRFGFSAGPSAPRVVLASSDNAAEFTSADAIKLVLVSSGVQGDANADCIVNGLDLPAFLNCMTGPDNGPVPAACDRHDFDRDGDVDMADLAAFQQAVSLGY